MILGTTKLFRLLCHHSILNHTEYSKTSAIYSQFACIYNIAYMYYSYAHKTILNVHKTIFEYCNLIMVLVANFKINFGLLVVIKV